MRILAVDTASGSAGCAVTENGRILAETTLNNGKTHASHLVPMMDALLKLLGMRPEDMDAFAVTDGPGSFTGLRIGAVTMKAVAYAAKRPLVGVSALETMCAGMVPTDGVVCPVIDARNRQVFTAIYRLSGDNRPVPITEEAGIPIEELAAQLRAIGSPVLLTGDAADQWRSVLAEFSGQDVRVASPSLHLPRAAAVALLAERKLQEAESSGHAMSERFSPFTVNPRYLRKSQAERLKAEQKQEIESGRDAHA